MNTFFSQLNGFDNLCLILISISVLYGLKRGLWGEVIALLTWCTAFFVSILFTDDLGAYLTQYVKTEFLAIIVSFLILFFVTLIIGGLLNYIINKLISVSGLALINRFLGGLFGILRGSLIILFVVFLLSLTALKAQPWFTGSKTTVLLQEVTDWMQTRIVSVAALKESNAAQASHQVEQPKPDNKSSLKTPETSHNILPNTDLFPDA